MTASTTQPSSNGDGQPPRRLPGTSDVIVRSPILGAPWDYGPGTDLDGAQFTPRLAPARRRMTRNATRPD